MLKLINGTQVFFENFLESFLILAKMKPKENGYLKLKFFAYLMDFKAKNSLTKKELIKSIYYACLYPVFSYMNKNYKKNKKLDEFYFKIEQFLASRFILLPDEQTEISLTLYNKYLS